MLLLVSLATAPVPVASCTMSSPHVHAHTYHCSLELAGGVTGVHNKKSAGEGREEGACGQRPPLSATTGLPAGHTNTTLVRRRARNHNHNNQNKKKKTNPTLCSPITRHQGCDTARQTRNRTRAGTHDHTRALYSKQRTTPHTRTQKRN